MRHLLVLGVSFVLFHVSLSAIPEFCSQPPDEGRGSVFIQALYYDPASNLCNPFLYKGEGGNTNRFLSDKDCMKNCSDKVEDFYPTEASKVCVLPKTTGSCSGRYMKFYYDPLNDKCKLFTWTGCHGNANRFPSVALCNQTCFGIHDATQTETEAESDTPVAIICGVLLAVIVIAVIITVVVLTVKSKKKKSNKKAKAKAKDPQADSPLHEPIEVA